MSNLLLEFDEMYQALLDRNSEYDGVVFFGVRTTGFFCRVTCPSRKPNRQNVAFFQKTADALAAGFRPCKRCKPMEVAGKMPEWLEAIVQNCEQDPGRKWKDADFRHLGVDPRRIRRWFLQHHGITFQYFLRTRRLSTALGELSIGNDILEVAANAGYESLSGFQTAFQQLYGCRAADASPAKDAILVNRLLSPLGPMVIASDEQQIYLLEFADRRMLETQFLRLSKIQSRPLIPGENQMMVETQKQLDDYFQGTRTEFELSISIRGTKFQESVWRALLNIGYGQTMSYEQIATKIENPNAQRAVGKANGDNRLAILIPCHRVIRQNGELSGYGGGVRRKEWMLSHEKAQMNASTPIG